MNRRGFGGGPKNMKHLKNIFAVFTLVFALSAAAAAQSKTLVSLDGENINIDGQKGKVTVLAIS
jgi:hypothetical protein